MHPLLQRVFETRQVNKHYRLASTSVRDNHSWEHTGSIGRDPRHPVLRQVVIDGGQPAQTQFSSVGTAQVSGVAASIYEAKPITGRTHQIRVHSAASGIPIIGDNFYGGVDAPYLHLVSYRIRLIHPITSVQIDLKLPASMGPSWVHN
jgi:23S rRNA-/tRNA-specific pseudouridylate synthase